MSAMDHAWLLLKEVVEDDGKGPYTDLLQQFMEEFEAKNPGKQEQLRDRAIGRAPPMPGMDRGEIDMSRSREPPVPKRKVYTDKTGKHVDEETDWRDRGLGRKRVDSEGKDWIEGRAGKGKNVGSPRWDIDDAPGRGLQGGKTLGEFADEGRDLTSTALSPRQVAHSKDKTDYAIQRLREHIEQNLREKQNPTIEGGGIQSMADEINRIYGTGGEEESAPAPKTSRRRQSTAYRKPREGDGQ